MHSSLRQSGIVPLTPEHVDKSHGRQDNLFLRKDTGVCSSVSTAWQILLSQEGIYALNKLQSKALLLTLSSSHPDITDHGMSGRTLSELTGNGSSATALPTHILLQATSPCYWEHQHPPKQLRLKDNHMPDLRWKSLSLLSYIKISLQFLWLKHAPDLSSHY